MVETVALVVGIIATVLGLVIAVIQFVWQLRDRRRKIAKEEPSIQPFTQAEMRKEIKRRKEMERRRSQIRFRTPLGSPIPWVRREYRLRLPLAGLAPMVGGAVSWLIYFLVR